MINIKEINEEIDKLENCNTSYAVCNKLAMLYIVRDHLMKDAVDENPNKMMSMSKSL